MFKRILSVFTVFATTLALAASFGAQADKASAQQAGCQTFPQTGKTVCGTFLTYWQSHGGVQQQGYPISNEFSEVSEVDGKSYTVQYFERAEFEKHPENQPPYDVLLSLLGTARLKEKYPKGAPEPPPPMNPLATQGMFFPQTGKSINGEFLDYWKANGGLMQQGYPLTNRFPEKSDLDGKTYTVQYFERAVFELHPENQPPYNVLLTQLGTLRYKEKYPIAGSGVNSSMLPAGTWGGEHIALTVTDKGATVEYDCAHGTISQPIMLDSNGQFDVVGTHVYESGVAGGQDQVTHPARFTGTLNQGVLALHVTVTDQPNQPAGNYKLTLGKQPSLFKCM
ncbi:MAG: hypothetical protein IVW55_15255 [Chloroflexi bacterium]|nr:hypothetical protein [Chloroflexota bacterium]